MVGVLTLLLRQPLHLPLAHRDERLLHGHWPQAAPHRGRLAARAGGHDALLHDHRGPGRQPDRFGHDADRLPAGAAAAVGGHHRAADPRRRSPTRWSSSAILWSLFGTAVPGPGRHQAAGPAVPQPAGRGGLPQGTGLRRGRRRPAPIRRPCAELFANVRRNYFRLYFHYMYFNVARIFYLQTDNIFRLTWSSRPTIVAGAITLGAMNQILNAFDQVRTSFQYLVNSWTTIVELLSIYKRLRAFEATIYGEPLPVDRPRVHRDASRPRPAAGRWLTRSRPGAGRPSRWSASTMWCSWSTTSPRATDWYADVWGASPATPTGARHGAGLVRRRADRAVGHHASRRRKAPCRRFGRPQRRPRLHRARPVRR